MIPTPADLARRARPAPPVAAAGAPTPPATGRVDPSRYAAEIQRAGLHPSAVRVGLALAALADPDSGLIPDARQPTQRTLGHSVELSRGRLLHSLRRLEEAGWLVRRSAAGRMRFVLAQPARRRP